MAENEKRYVLSKDMLTTEKTVAEEKQLAADAVAIAELNSRVNALEEASTTAVKGVKGSAEAEYRHGNVNLTLANLGYTSANNLTTTETGKLLDARQGKELSDRIGNLTDLETPEKGNLVASINSAQEQLNDHTRVLGAKNLLPNPYRSGYSVTYNGITFTVRDDGSFNTNGTASADTFLVFHEGENNILTKGQRYIISSGQTSNGGMQVYYKASASDNWTKLAGAVTSEVEFTVPDDANIALIRGYIGNGNTVSNKVYYPMLRLASDPDPTYAPYAMTNRELTEKVGKAYSDLATVEPTATASKAYAAKEYLVYNGQLYKVTSAIASGGTITPGTNVTAVKVTDEMGSGDGSIDYLAVQNGKVCAVYIK